MLAQPSVHRTDDFCEQHVGIPAQDLNRCTDLCFLRLSIDRCSATCSTEHQRIDARLGRTGYHLRIRRPQ